GRENRAVSRRIANQQGRQDLLLEKPPHGGKPKQHDGGAIPTAEHDRASGVRWERQGRKRVPPIVSNGGAPSCGRGHLMLGRFRSGLPRTPGVQTSPFPCRTFGQGVLEGAESPALAAAVRC